MEGNVDNEEGDTSLLQNNPHSSHMNLLSDMSSGFVGNFGGNFGSSSHGRSGSRHRALGRDTTGSRRYWDWCDLSESPTSATWEGWRKGLIKCFNFQWAVFDQVKMLTCSHTWLVLIALDIISQEQVLKLPVLVSIQWEC